VAVVDRVCFEVRGGEIHGLLGANGAGKSTLCRMIAGLVASSDGTMTLHGVAYRPTDKASAEQRGVVMVQQELNLVPTLTVAENLMLTRMPARFGVIRWRQLIEQARAILDRFGLRDLDPTAKTGDLGIGRQQMVEIAAALARDCRLLILDEPTAALSGGETRQLFQWLSELRAQGVGMVYVTHRLDEVVQLTDRITILRDGTRIHTGSTSTLTTDRMVELMSGAAACANESDLPSPARTSAMALRVQDLCSGPVQQVSFDLHMGERLGVAGLVGSGRTELLRAIFGADIADSGGVMLDGQTVLQRFRSLAEAVAAGLAMVTEDRAQSGLLLSRSLRMNVSLSALQRDFSTLGVVRNGRERAAAVQQVKSMEIRCTGLEQTVSELSGGNQQKVAVAKWLVRDARVFLFDEPTRGIDVAARRRIYRVFAELAAAGKGILIVSSDLAELTEVCDRIVVLSAGRVVDTFQRGEWSEDEITQACFANYRSVDSNADRG
jgi:ribose transport system ATP-binding protein